MIRPRLKPPAARPRSARRVACAMVAGAAMSPFASSGLAATSRSDFNGDGFDDLAIAIPNQDVSGAVNAGAVQILYGRANGVRFAQAQLFTQDSPGMPDSTANSDRFGSSLAWGDFNNDGFDDLAIGTPLDDVGGPLNRPDTGSVTIIYGTAVGLDPDGEIDAEFFRQGSGGVRDTAETNDQFGWTLAVGDFDGDGFDDLAVGVIGEDLALATDAGAVHVFYGRNGGLGTFGDELWTLNSGGVPEAAFFGDRFGYALAAGDFDGDGRDDLAIGAPARAVAITPGFGFADRAGAVFVIQGSVTGLTGSGAKAWTQSTPGIDGLSEPNDNFGYALAAGDFNRDGRDDLAIGEPFDDVGGFIDFGAVHVLYGANLGLAASGSIVFTDGASNNVGQGALFGFALAVGDFDDDGTDDLAVSAPRQPSSGFASAGGVFVYEGLTGEGINPQVGRVWTQDSQGIRDFCDDDDRFGESLRTGDFNGDGRDDLVVGSPREDFNLISNSGAINVIYGTKHGLRARDNQFIAPGAPNAGGMQAQPENGGFFGFSTTVSP